MGNVSRICGNVVLKKLFSRLNSNAKTNTAPKKVMNANVLRNLVDELTTNVLAT